MKINVVAGKIEKQRTDGLVIPVFDDKNAGPNVGRADKALGGMIMRLIKREEFKPKPGAVHLVYPEGRLPAERLILVGLGKRSDLTLNRVRHAAGKAAQYLRAAGASEISITAEGIGLDTEEIGQALTEGALLGLYRFLKYKTNDENERKKDIRTITLLTDAASEVRAMRKGAGIGEVVAGSTMITRDLVSAAPIDKTPTIIAARARELARQFGLKIQVLEQRQMEKLGMGGLLGVASGSAQPPKFIIIEYRKGGSKPFIALVGKTITFDSGGISIKPAENMDKMKDDMSGGAAVLGAIRCAAQLKLPLNIVGLLPATENMPGGRAYKPGDVLRTMSGQTIEIL
ncbi:MAG TPA: M17 family peptidase N-terminal domain-containing protein, partial [Nitrospirota bacterium]